MSTELDAFRARYDPRGNLRFDGIKFRPGTPFSVSKDQTPAAFALVEGFRQTEAGMEWGWVRFHMGTDRGPHPPAVYAPFDAESTAAHDDGGLVYGWNLRLICDRWGFEVRIAHMDPRTDVRSDVLEIVRAGGPLEAGRLLGHCGYYGLSSAADPRDRAASAHTHTEIVSITEDCQLLDELLALRWGQEALRPYEEGEVIAAYRDRARYRDALRETIMEAWAVERRAKGLLWANRFRAQFSRDRYLGHRVTRYSSALLFAGM